MNVITLNLRDEVTEHGFMPTMKAYLIEGNPNEKEYRPAIVICPGGAYSHVSFREGERVALQYAAAGFHVFIIDYSVAPHKFPMAIKEVAHAFEMIRENAEQWLVDSSKIAVCGFSAGGHLAASISTLWNDKEIFPYDDEVNMLHKPDLSILCYPVITSGEYAHRGSFQCLLGEDESVWETYSLEKRVDATTPQAFLWHTCSDEGVPVENSLLYAQALRKHGIYFDMHIYQDGGHGMSIVSDEKKWSVPKFTREYPWVKESIAWLNVRWDLAAL